MTASLKRFLKEFDARPSHLPRAMAGSDSPAAAAAAPVVDAEAIRAAAYEEGRQAATDALSADHHQALASLAEEHAAALAALKQRYEDETAERIEKRFVELFARLGESLGRDVATVLDPLVKEAITEKMAAAFAEAVIKALGERAVTRLTLSGPAGLFARIAKSESLSGIELRHVETEDVDISVEIDGTVFSTRLGAFADALSEVLP